MYATTDTLATTPAAQGGRSRWLALYTLCAGMLMIVLDVTVVNVALPAIQDDLGFTSSSLAWVVNAYLIAFGGLLAAGRPARRPARPAEHLRRRAGRLHRRLGALRTGRVAGGAGRSPASSRASVAR